MFSSIYISLIGLLLSAITSSSELFSFGLPFSGLFSSGLFSTLSPESSPFSFFRFIFAITSFIPISNSLLIANISTIFTDIFQMLYLGFLLYLILIANKVISVKFSEFLIYLLLILIFFIFLNFLNIFLFNFFLFVLYYYFIYNIVFFLLDILFVFSLTLFQYLLAFFLYQSNL